MYISDTLRVYDVPVEAPNRTGIFSVKVNGHPLGLLSERNEWEKPVSFGVFDLAPGTAITVEIEVSRPFAKAELLPESEGVTAEIEGTTVRYTADRPINGLSLVLDGAFQGEVLHLFSNPIDLDAPMVTDEVPSPMGYLRLGEDLLYFPPGYYDLTKDGGTGELCLTSGQTLYLAGGAVVDGTVGIYHGENVTVRGSGILVKSEEVTARSSCQSICLVTAESRHIRVEGIVCHAHRWHNWTVHFWRSSHIEVRRLKILSPVYASTDGIDISNTSHVMVEDSFLRACDDCVALKGLYGEEDRPADCLPIEDIHFRRCVMWNDCNNCMGLGAETRASVYRNISFREIEVIYSYDDREHHEQLDERSVMTVCCLHGTFFEDIVWENIRIHTCQRLICLTFRDDFWFGTIPGDQSTPGGMKNILFRNVTMEHREPSAITGEILLHGREGKKIQNVTLDHVTVCGEAPVVTANEFTEEIRVI